MAATAVVMILYVVIRYWVATIVTELTFRVALLGVRAVCLAMRLLPTLALYMGRA